MSIIDTRELLEARLAELGAAVERIEAAQGEPLEADFAEQAVAREDDEPLDGIERAALLEIEQIRHALARLDAGTYGRCTSCGAPIAAARLAVAPAVALCIGCASGR
jgi:RNA polymerase-binding transcription factor DksA